MKIAILSDIHGNLLALEAVVAKVKTEAPDLTVNLGDCLSGPLWPVETASLLMAEKNWPTVRGNHDRQLFERPISELDDSDQFVLPRLSKAVMGWLEALPVTLVVEDNILLCHGSPASDEVYLLEEDGGDHFYPSPEDRICAKLGDGDATLVLCGHTHTPHVVRLSGGTTILNPGSVGIQAYPGLTLTGSPHARYATAEYRSGSWTFRHHAVEYDWDAAAKQSATLGFEDWSNGLATGFSPRSSTD